MITSPPGSTDDTAYWSVRHGALVVQGLPSAPDEATYIRGPAAEATAFTAAKARNAIRQGKRDATSGIEHSSVSVTATEKRPLRRSPMLPNALAPQFTPYSTRWGG